MNNKKLFALTTASCLSANLFASMSVTFDTSAFVDTSGLYVTFAGTDSDMVYDPGDSNESIIFSGGTINIGGTDYGTSKSYLLSDITTNGLTLNSATSLIGFVSYGGTTGIEQLSTGVQPDPFSQTTSRYSNFEITYSGTGGGADLTNISQFGGSLKMEFLEGTTTQSYVANTLNTGDMFRALAETSGGASSPAVLTDGGNFRRVVGPNKFPASIGGVDQQTPYPTFNAYLQNLYTSSDNGANKLDTELTNLAPGANPGGMGSAGFDSTAGADSSRVDPSTGYNLDYHFEANVEQVDAPDGNAPNGTYKVTLSGHVNATSQDDPGDTYTYNNLSITINADSPGDALYYMTNFVYQETIVDNPNIIDVDLAGWDDLVTDFGQATTEGALQLKAAGDFAQALLGGLIGSDVEIDGTPIGEMTSYELWTEASQYAYAPAQPDDEFYSLWGEVIAANSESEIDGEFYARLGVYGSPFDDRYSINLISPDADTTEMRITLLSDGNLSTIPEPGNLALAAGLVAACTLFLRRRRNN